MNEKRQKGRMERDRDYVRERDERGRESNKTWPDRERSRSRGRARRHR